MKKPLHYSTTGFEFQESLLAIPQVSMYHIHLIILVTLKKIEILTCLKK